MLLSVGSLVPNTCSFELMVLIGLCGQEGSVGVFINQHFRWFFFFYWEWELITESSTKSLQHCLVETKCLVRISSFWHFPVLLAFTLCFHFFLMSMRLERKAEFSAQSLGHHRFRSCRWLYILFFFQSIPKQELACISNIYTEAGTT